MSASMRGEREKPPSAAWPHRRSSPSWKALASSAPSSSPRAMETAAHSSVSQSTTWATWRLLMPSMLYRPSSRLRCFIRNELV